MTAAAAWRADTVTDEQTVSEDVRKEQIEVDGANDVYPAAGGKDETRTSTDMDVEPRK